jgi:acyl-CoA hydrolase
MPNAVCSLLLHSGVENLGIHTEMLTDGIIDLYRSGVVNGSAKNVHPGKIVCSFAAPTARRAARRSSACRPRTSATASAEVGSS